MKTLKKGSALFQALYPVYVYGLPAATHPIHALMVATRSKQLDGCSKFEHDVFESLSRIDIFNTILL